MKNISYRKKPTKTKEIKYITKQINDLNREILLTERLKQESQNKYEKQSFKITETKVKLEKELDSILKTLNEKENKIYNIQKLNLENFKKEISKYTKILEELERKKIEINIDISTIEKNISDLTQKIFKMKKSYKNNVKNSENLKEEAENILKELHELENKYPDEFNYLRENIQFQNSIIQLNTMNKEINNIIKEKKRKIDEYNKIKNNLEEKLNDTEKEKNKDEEELNNLFNNDMIKRLSEYIRKEISDKFLWDNLREIINKYNIELNIENEGMSFLNRLNKYLTQEINDIYNNTYLKEKKENENKLKSLNRKKKQLEMKSENEGKEYIHIIGKIKDIEDKLKIDNDKFMKIYTLYTNTVNLLNNITEENKTEIFNQYCRSILIENNNNYKESKDDYRKNYENLIGMYLKEINSKAKNINNINQSLNRNNEEIENLNNELNKINNELHTLKTQIKSLSNERKINFEKIKNINSNLALRNQNLKNSFEQLSKEEYNEFIKENEETLNHIKKFYGTKMVNKVNKEKKEELYQDKVMEHMKIRESINKCLNFINNYQAKNKIIKDEYENISPQYQDLNEELNELNEKKEEKIKNQHLIEKSSKELNDKINQILLKKEENFIYEKKRLYNLENMNYYFDKIKSIKLKLDNLEKNKLQNDNNQEKNQTELNTKRLELREKNINLKKQLINLQMNIKNSNEEENNKLIKENKKNNDFEQLINITSDINKKGELFNARTISLNNNEKDEEEEFLLYSEIMLPLLEGIEIYQKYGDKVKQSKEFNPFNFDNPLDFGYKERILLLNLEDDTINFYYDETLKRIESKFYLKDIKGLFLTLPAKKIIKEKKKGEYNNLINKDNIPIAFITNSDNIELIIPNYTNYLAIENLMDPHNKENYYKLKN